MDAAGHFGEAATGLNLRRIKSRVQYGVDGTVHGMRIRSGKGPGHPKKHEPRLRRCTYGSTWVERGAAVQISNVIIRLLVWQQQYGVYVHE